MNDKPEIAAEVVMTPKKRGPKSIYSNEIKDKLCQAVGLGSTLEQACAYAGINYTNVFDWLATGLPQYTELAEALKQAKAQRLVGRLALIQKAAAEGTWQAAAWLLEREYPEQFGARRLEITGPGGGPIQIAQVVVIPAPAANGADWAARVAAEVAQRALGSEGEG